MISALLLLLAQSTGLPECKEDAAERGIQQEMNICAHRDFVIADEALNAQWSETRALMRERDEQWNDGHAPDWDKRPGFFETLLEGQRAWITFRDAHCRLDGYTARGGSLEPLLVSTCKTALTKARTMELKEMVNAPR